MPVTTKTISRAPTILPHRQNFISRTPYHPWAAQANYSGHVNSLNKYSYLAPQVEKNLHAKHTPDLIWLSAGLQQSYEYYHS